MVYSLLQRGLRCELLVPIWGSIHGYGRVFVAMVRCLWLWWCVPPGAGCVCGYGYMFLAMV